MRTFLQLLRIGFWMLPLQRALTVIGTVVVLVGEWRSLLFHQVDSGLSAMLFGVMLILAVPLLAGGVFFRMLSASRALLLRPHARGRLLAGVVAVLLLVTCAWIACYWFIFQTLPARYQPDLENYILMFVMALSFGTLCSVTLFIASRSPLWALLILVIWQAPGLLLHLFGVEDASRLLGGPVSLVTSAVVWAGFSIWFLRARHVHASSWGRGKGVVAEANIVQVVVPATREQAMTRWLLGGTTPLGIGTQCLLAALGVLGIQWIFARDSGVGPLHAMMFGTLSLVAVVAGAVSRTMANRARGLWLPAGRTRLALHAWTERQMLLVVLAIFGAVVLAGALVWWLLPRPTVSPGYLLCAMLAPGLAAAWLGMMQQHRRSPVDALAAIAIVLGWSYGVVEPVYSGSPVAHWKLLAAQAALIVLLREIAYVRWRSADWRRVQRA